MVGDNVADKEPPIVLGLNSNCTEVVVNATMPAVSEDECRNWLFIDNNTYDKIKICCCCFKYCLLFIIIH